MLSDLGRQITDHVDATASPVDVDSLIRGLTAAAPPDRRFSPPIRARVVAFAGAALTAVMVIGGSIALFWRLGDTSSGPVGGAESGDAGLSATRSLWWFVVIAVAAAVIAVTAAAVRRRTTPRTKENVMQTVERGIQTVDERDDRIATLERHRRFFAWLAGIVLIAGVVVIAWPPAEISESSESQQAVADVMDRYWTAMNDGDFDAMRELLTPNAAIEDATLVYDVDGWIGNLEFWRSSGTYAVAIPGVQLIGGKFVVQRVIEEWPTVTDDILVVAEFDRASNRIMRLELRGDIPES
jgi:hypothetical protein